MLWLIVTRSEVDIEGGLARDPETRWYPVPITAPPPDRYHRDWVAMKDIPVLVEELQAKKARCEAAVRQLENLREASKALGMKESAKETAEIKQRTAEIDEINSGNSGIFRLQTEPYRRWSNGFTCLCFAMIGIPVSMLWRHVDGLTNFFVCFLPILALYYPLLMFGEDLSTSGALPPISFWMGNVILAAPAVALLRWVNQH